jgi:lipopolysaccharide export system protein LptC
MAMPSLTRDSLKAYTHFVLASKVMLSLLVLMVLVFMVAIPLVGKQKSGVRVAFGSIEEKQEDTPPIMMNPRFQGVDNNNQAYLVTASTALQTDNTTITLEEVEADLTTKDNAWLALMARQGILDLDAQSLLLQGNVQLYHDGGNEMRTEQVRLDFENMAAFGESPVQVQGNFGHIRADQFSILDRGDRLLFNHHVYVLLLPQ